MSKASLCPECVGRGWKVYNQDKTSAVDEQRCRSCDGNGWVKVNEENKEQLVEIIKKIIGINKEQDLLKYNLWYELIDKIAQEILKEYVRKEDVGLDEERIAIILFEVSIYSEMYSSWDTLPQGYKDMFLRQAKAIVRFK